MFSKILIANRGEIAVRIIRACKEMGVATVAVYSEADKNALHVALADQSYCIGGPEASESYLNENQIISTAILAGAQAIHPGYGFLSENAHFARACRKNGLVFIGPDPESMERLSDKAILKELIRGTGLSVIPGTNAVASAQEAKRAADRIGYPVMLKACQHFCYTVLHLQPYIHFHKPEVAFTVKQKFKRTGTYIADLLYGIYRKLYNLLTLLITNSGRRCFFQ